MDALTPVSTPVPETRIAKTPARAAATDAPGAGDAAVDAFVAALMALGAQPVAVPQAVTVAVDPGQALPAAAPEIAAATLGPVLQRSAAPVTPGATGPAGAGATGDDDAAVDGLVEVFTALKEAAGAGVGEDKPVTPGIAVPGTDDDRPGKAFGALLAAQHGPASNPTDGAGAQFTARPDASHAATQVYTPKGLSLPVARPEVFAEGLNQTVNIMLSQRLQEARIDVNPPDLGPVEVRVSISGDQANIQLAAPHAATRDALAEAMPRLRASFADGGISLGQAGVFTELPQQRQAQNQRGDETAPNRGHGDAEEGVETVKLPLSRLRRGLVDAFI